MVVVERHLTVPGLLESIAVAVDFVTEAAQYAGLDDRSVGHCQLAVDEACTNIIEHGYNSEGADEVIDIVCRKETGRFTILVYDDSPAFDPLLVIEPDPKAALESREPGGWGVYFIKQVMDEVSYRYENNRNRLSMTKQLDVPPEMVSREASSRLADIIISAAGNDVWRIAPRGRMDRELAMVVEQVLKDQLGAGRRLLIVDLTHVDYIASYGLKIIVSLWQRARAADGEIALTSLRPRVREVFNLIGLDLVLPIYESAAEAISSLKMK